MEDEAVKVETPIEEVPCAIGGLRVRDGVPNVIEFRVGIVVSNRSAGFLEYLVSCLAIGGSVTLRRAGETMDEALINAEPSDIAKAQRGDLFPNWPNACGAPTMVYGMQAKCSEGHTTATTPGEPCSYMPDSPNQTPISDEGTDAT